MIDLGMGGRAYLDAVEELGVLVLRLDGIHGGVGHLELPAGLADLDAHPEVEEGVGHEHQHHVAVLPGQLDRRRHG